MNLSQRKAINTKLANGDSMTFQNALDMFFLPDDQDVVAQSHGWEDAAQMAYYEDMKSESEQLPPPPAEIQVDGLIAELAKVDPREVYGDFEPLRVTNSFYERLHNRGYNTRNIKIIDSE